MSESKKKMSHDRVPKCQSFVEKLQRKLEIRVTPVSSISECCPFFLNTGQKLNLLHFEVPVEVAFV